MIKVYKKESSVDNNNEIRVIDFETGEFTHYLQDKSIGFIFSVWKTNIKDMGYKTVKECIKALKQRCLLGQEVDYEEQLKSEKLGLINLGVYRIKRVDRVNTNDFKDVIEKLSKYGLGFTDAQNQIIKAYEHSLNLI